MPFSQPVEEIERLRGQKVGLWDRALMSDEESPEVATDEMFDIYLEVRCTPALSSY
jgi:hypothetical protein